MYDTDVNLIYIDSIHYILQLVTSDMHTMNVVKPPNRKVQLALTSVNELPGTITQVELKHSQSVLIVSLK